MTAEGPNARQEVLDVGAGNPEAPANAIPNVLANLVETETWRNAATVVMMLLLLGMGYWAYRGVRDAIAASQVAELDAQLGTVARGLEVWAGEYRAEAVRIAMAPPVADLAAQLASAGREQAARACGRPEEAGLRKAVLAQITASDSAGYVLLDREGRLLSASLPFACGERVRSPVFRRHVDLAVDGAVTFVRPHPESPFPGDGRRAYDRPLAWVLAPIRAEGGAVFAVLALGIAADREFARLFGAGRAGREAEAFAIAEDGTALTASRAAEELAEAGRLALLTEGDGRFGVPVRDPGGALAEGHVPAAEPGAWPLTQAAALAVAARAKADEGDRRGMVAQPYRNVAGREVLGAWRWLPAFGIGIVAERSAEAALGAMRYLQISFTVIAGFVVLSLVAALTSALLIARLKRQVGRLQRLGAYTLERQISEGGMATIYLARHALLKRPTAVKILKKHVGTDEFIHRFEREVQLVSQLLHPNTVRIYDFGRTGEGQPYYVMEYLDGITLTELVAHSGPVPPGRVIHVLRQLAGALREAHQRGLVHRDVKPDNIMLCRRGEDDVVKLLDFGLVKDVESLQTRDVTKQIKILGTPRYMSPERLANPADVDARADLYALGAVGYYLLTGRHAFEGEDNLAISHQVMHTSAPRVRAAQPEVPEGLDALIAACLEKDRLRRPASADAVIEALDRLSTRLAWTARDAAAWWSDYLEARGGLLPTGPFENRDHLPIATGARKRER